jgi:thiol-disulfide isomerase/thioredoxin
MTARRGFISALAAVMIIGLGCKRTDERKEQKEDAALSAITVAPIDKNGLSTLIAKRNGKTLLLNIWATWCAPCVAEFPDLVKLSKSYDTSAVEVVAISADYPDEVDSRIIPFLRKTNVPFRVYVARFEHQEDFINAVNTSWSGALPATLIYNARGESRFFHVGELSLAEFKQEVDRIKGAL